MFDLLQGALASAALASAFFAGSPATPAPDLDTWTRADHVAMLRANQDCAWAAQDRTYEWCVIGSFQLDHDSARPLVRGDYTFTDDGYLTLDKD